LLETKSLGGTSGSPFFLHLYPNAGRNATVSAKQRRPDGGLTLPYYLIGMIQGSHSGQYANEFIGQPDDDGELQSPKDVDFNAGIAIGIPIAQIMEVINRPDLVQMREAAVRAKDHVMAEKS